MEPWLTTTGRTFSDPRAADLDTRLRQALYWIENFLEETPEEALWWQPSDKIAGIGQRVQHITGSARRLADYAFEAVPDPEQLADNAKQDWKPTGGPVEDLISALVGVVEEIRTWLGTASPELLDAVCYLGRKRLPVRRIDLLHHVAEHAVLHAGQLILILRMWQAKGER